MSNEVKLSDILLRASELVVSRDGDVTNEDGDFACVDIDSIIHLECDLARFFDLNGDDVIRSDLPLIKARSDRFDRLVEENAKLREALADLVETSDINEAQLSQELLEFHEDSAALSLAKKLLSELVTK